MANLGSYTPLRAVGLLTAPLLETVASCAPVKELAPDPRK